MNSTNEIESKIKAIFDDVIMANSHGNYLHTVINKNIDSYYEDPQHSGQAYYSFIDASSVENLAGYLNDFWMEPGSEQFTTMAAAISELAFLLSAGDDQNIPDDISPFIYAMY